MNKLLLKKINKQDAIRIAIYVITFVAFFVELLCIKERKLEDILDYQRVNAEGYNMMETMVAKYYTWSSRLIMDYIRSSFSLVPFWVFKIFFAFVFTGICKAIALLLHERRPLMVTFINVVMFAFPVYYVSDCGMISATVHYAFPFMMLLIACIVFSNKAYNMENKKSLWVISCIAAVVASNTQVTCAILLGVTLFSIVYFYIKDKVFVKAYVAYLIIPVAGIIWHLTCPGNANREAFEIATQLPEFENWTFLDKLTQGVFHGLNGILVCADTRIFIYILLLLTIRKNISNKIKLVISVVCTALYFGLTKGGFFNYELANLFGQQSTDGLYMAVMLVMAVLIVVCLFISFENSSTGIWFAAVAIAGCCSAFVLGFSPTILASGVRIYDFCIFALIICICALIQEIMQKNKPGKLYLAVNAVTFIAASYFVLRLVAANYVYVQVYANL